jgi:hypothetical protein
MHAYTNGVDARAPSARLPLLDNISTASDRYVRFVIELLISTQRDPRKDALLVMISRRPGDRHSYHPPQRPHRTSPKRRTLTVTTVTSGRTVERDIAHAAQQAADSVIKQMPLVDEHTLATHTPSRRRESDSDSDDEIFRIKMSHSQPSTSVRTITLENTTSPSATTADESAAEDMVE